MRRTKHYCRLGSTCVLAFGLAAILSGCPSIGTLLATYGYTELKPPSRLMAPGTMVWIKDTDPFTAGVICTADTSLGKDFTPLESPTSSSTLSKANGKNFVASADLLSQIKGDARFDAVDSLLIRLDNAVIYELTDMDVADNIKNRDPTCARMIKARLARGYKVSVISSALKADATFTIQFKREAKLDAKAKLDMVQNLAVELGADANTATTNSVTSTGLYVAIKSDPYLAEMALDDPEPKKYRLWSYDVPAPVPNIDTDLFDDTDAMPHAQD